MQRKTLPVWKTSPFIRILFPFLLGILLQQFSSFKISPLSLPVLLLLIVILLVIRGRYLYFRLRYFTGLLLLVTLFIAGWLRSNSTSIINQPRWYGKAVKSPAVLQVSAEEPPVQLSQYFRVYAGADSLQLHGSLPVSVTGRIECRFTDKDFATKLEKQSAFIIEVSALQPAPESSPGSFNYKQYLIQNDIVHIAYLNADNSRLADRRKNYPLAIRLRSQLVERLQRFCNNEAAAAFGAAILLGARAELDPELKASYARLGIIHLLAISGLHLGLVYLLLSTVIAKIFRVRNPLASTLLLLTSLWFFVVLTGASASVCRAGLMISFLLLGKLVKRKNSSLNALAAAAFCLLLIKPSGCLQPGFQLSFGAVAGILLFANSIQWMICFDHPVIRFFWQGIAVTFAAQIFTTAISLYYFHQIPILVLFTNLLIVPFASLVLLATMFTCIFSSIPPLAEFCGGLLTELISLLNRFVAHIDRIPFASIGDIYISPVTAITLCLMPFILPLAGAKARKVVIALLLLLVAWKGLTVAIQLHDRQQQKLIVFPIKHGAASLLTDGPRSWLLTDTAITREEFFTTRMLSPAQRALNLDSIQLCGLPRQSVLFHLGALPVLFTGGQAAVLESRAAQGIIVFDQQRWFASEELDGLSLAKTWVLTASLSKKTRRWLTQEAKRRNLHYWDIKSQGAFVMPAN